MSRRMFRYTIPADGQVRVLTLTGEPVAVAATRSHPLANDEVVEFWAEHDEGAGATDRAFCVFGTGHALPDDARWVGTCPRTPDGLIWHLYEMKVPRVATAL